MFGLGASPSFVPPAGMGGIHLAVFDFPLQMNYCVLCSGDRECPTWLVDHNTDAEKDLQLNALQMIVYMICSPLTQSQC